MLDFGGVNLSWFFDNAFVLLKGMVNGWFRGDTSLNTFVGQRAKEIFGGFREGKPMIHQSEQYRPKLY